MKIFVLMGSIIIALAAALVLRRLFRLGSGSVSKSIPLRGDDGGDDLIWELGKKQSSAEIPPQLPEISSRAFLRSLAGGLVVLAGFAAARGRDAALAGRMALSATAKPKKHGLAAGPGGRAPIHIDGPHGDAPHTDTDTHVDNTFGHNDSIYHYDQVVGGQHQSKVVHTDGPIHNDQMTGHADYPHVDSPGC